MSPDWHGLLALALLVPVALGNLYHFVLAVNVVSAHGFSEVFLDRARALLFAGMWASSAYLLWKHIHHPWWQWHGLLFAYAVLSALSGLVIGPLCSLRLALRRRPAGISGKSRVVDTAGPDGVESLIGSGSGAWLLRVPGNESFRLALREWDLAIPGLPPALEGLEIVQLTDFHFAPCYNRVFFERVADACRDWRADLLIVTGDIVESDDAVAWVEPVLGRLTARLGKFATLGNHDADHQPEEIISELKRASFTVLNGDWTLIDVHGASLAIGGTSAPWGPAWNDGEVPPADFRLLLSHSPDLFYKAQGWGVDLMFSGHNHGGQIRLPGAGPVFVPSRYSRRFDRGFFRGGKMLMYVSEGVGGMHPYRYGCLPEVCRFTLSREGRPDEGAELALGRLGAREEDV